MNVEPLKRMDIIRLTFKLALSAHPDYKGGYPNRQKNSTKERVRVLEKYDTLQTGYY